ncbi:hypothetical protein Osc7112_6472 (plasmid) [Oscillatoria nigro-viridis PCC 7112]|uniref:Uncharacterized protein n=1 Tax=Phormidium nigroviride PCC 7112 TaxID=179408 RepID=K9VRR1_9CYAN|nr:hypothetical protein [Oscillatoria nigro-viridis]AFZ10616.1 hypothetical protein Osc7112_6472 [Oscillatoria nigro-viridis PCC 7112]
MSKLKFSALISAVCMMSIFFYGWVGFSQSPQSTVRLTSEPPITQILPFEAEATTPLSPVSLKLQALDAAGIPLENARISLTILTPPKNPWFTTDFPIVEGTKLLDIEAVAAKGELQIQQMLPIRGNYQLLAKVTPIAENAFTPFEQTLTLSVPENGVKYRNFWILAAILLAVGLGGGLAIGGKPKIKAGEIAPERVRLLLSGAIIIAIATLLYVNVSAEIAQSEMSMPMSHMTESKPTEKTSPIVKSQGLQVRLSGDVSATVGKAANLQVQLTDTKTNQPVTDVLFNVKVTQLENDWIAFAYKGVPDAAGKLIWQEQFFDGAPHKVEVEVSPQPNAARQFPPFQVSQTIEVEGVAPPLSVRLTVLAYFTGIVVAGMAIGFGLQRRLLGLRLRVGRI